MISDGGLWDMLQFLDGLFPSGAFAHSFGLETLVQEGWVGDEAEAMEWLTEIVEDSWAWSDGMAATQVWSAGDRRNALEHAASVDAFLSASRASRESREGSLMIGRRILQEAARLLADPELVGYQSLVQGHPSLGNAAVVVSLIGLVRGWGETATLAGYAYFSVSGMVQALVRLIPLGQSSGQRLLHTLRPVAMAALDTVHGKSLEDMGSRMPLWEVAAMRHLVLYSRLFRS